MTDPVLFDNDIVLKVCAYRLRQAALSSLAGRNAAILPTAKFSIKSVAERTERAIDRPGLIAEVARFLEQADIVEPTGSEIGLAADLEEAALQSAVALDSGESQLVAVLILRGFPLLLTGDKRAIMALHSIGDERPWGRIACLEQLLLAILLTTDVAEIRPAVCSEAKMDKAVTGCFACSSSEATLANVREGLLSYTEHLRGESGAVLAPDIQSTVVS